MLRRTPRDCSFRADTAYSALAEAEKAVVRVETEGVQVISAHTPEQVAESYAHIIPGKHKVRWLKERLADGRIPSKRLTRTVRVMTDKHIEEWLEGGEKPAEVVAPQPEPLPSGALVEGLSRRSHARIVRSA